MATIKLVAFAGSLRKDSWNKKLVKVAAAGARDAGAEVDFLDLAEYPMPIFDEDLEASEGIPKHAKAFKEILKSRHGFLISSPEYNSSISAALKNAIDWASRPEPNEAPLAAFSGKIAGLMGASPGNLGGLRGLVTLRMILGNIQVTVVPDQFALSKANEAFDAEGNLIDEKQRAAVHAIGRKVATVASKLLG